MASTDYFGTGFVIGEAFATPTPDNENLHLILKQA